MELTCEALGITPDQIADRVADKITDRLMNRYVVEVDEDGIEQRVATSTHFDTKVSEAVEARVKEAIDKIVSQVIGDNLVESLDALRFPQTNRYGEPKSDPLTLRELAAKQIENMLREEVDNEGRSGGSAYGTKQTRIVWAIHKYLKYSIENGLSRIMQNANEVIADGITKTVQAQLLDIAKTLKVEAKVSGK